MAINFKSNLSLGGLALQNAALHPESTAPLNAVEGQVYWDTGNKKLYVYGISNSIGYWHDVTGDITSVSAGDGISVSGGSGGDATVSLSHLGIESLADPGADRILFWDDSEGAAKWLTADTATGIKISTSNLQLDNIPNSALENGTFGVQGGAGLLNIAFQTPLGDTVTVDVGEGTGIAVNANDVAIKNADNFSDATVQIWNDSAGQFEDSPITDDGSAIWIGSDTTSHNLVVSGDLTVKGTTLTKDTQQVNIGDNIVLLNAEEAGSPTEDAGIEIERGTETNVSFLWNETDDYWSMGGKLRIETVESASSVISSTQVLVQGTTVGQVIQRASVSAIGSALGLGGHSILLHSTQRDHVSLTGNTYTVTHNLNSLYVIVQILDATTMETVYAEVVRDTLNTVQVTFGFTPTDGDYMCITTAVGNLDEANGAAT